MKTARLLSPLLLTSAFGLGALAGACTTREANPDHCSNNEGDQYCALISPDTPFCSNGNDAACNGSFPTGCVAAEDLLQGCADPCGSLSADECDGQADGSSSGTSGGTDDSGTDGMMTETEGSSGSTTENSTTCSGPEDCGGETPFCSDAGECVDCGGLADGDAACAEGDATTPVCDAGVCVQCTGENAGACVDATPTCGAANECVACSEHAHCPESACHLDGPDVGRCFDVGEVEMIADGAALTAALGELSAGDQAVFVLTAGSYGVTVGLADNVEVAFLSNEGAELSGAGIFDSVTLAGSAITYFGGVTIAGNTNAGGIACSGTSVWLDDSEVRNNDSVGLTVSGGCAAHLRRSVVSNNDSGGVEATGTTTVVSLETSVIASNGNGTSSFGGVDLDGAEFRAVYTTIAGNDSTDAAMSIRCQGSSSGDVRNSIVVGRDPDSVGECPELVLANSGTDGGDEPSNTVVGAFDISWFEDPAMGNFRLSDLGRDVFENIAMWQDGDPPTDIDGDPISMEAPSFPGYDQPSP
ncbi:MAG: right-handed parallel beta-helix repeat-containing protein [Myxococcota bacterium]